MVKTIGLMEAHSRLGIERLDYYSFKPPVLKSLLHILMEKESRFNKFSNLHIHPGNGYFPQAIKLSKKVNNGEKRKKLIFCAKDKLNCPLICIPHREYRRFHLIIR